MPVPFGVLGDFIFAILNDLQEGVTLSFTIDHFEADFGGDMPGAGNYAFSRFVTF